MVNQEDFTKRLRKLLRYYDLSASAFADRIGVQRSSISHLLTGRNKPSLDFILKVNDTFPEVDLYWFLKGKGTFPKTSSDTDLPVAPTPSLLKKAQNPNIGKHHKSVDKIIILHSDGSFKIYGGD
ncbi:helix-turn-helix domain-containing protein [Ulvibacterium marinum]|uniref:helix-turn-helix domain-containing protein n=1 Tax=Ulvibacterium marinum TaxID=2419782 RepID=UPI0024948882|nr:helix-turn-helix transcriptional regulator [Ulvibacterium marinum]